MINTVNEIFTIGRAKRVIHLYTQDYQLDGKRITLHGESKINFGSCSYLGLELDQRLKEAGIDAINRYGAQFSSSRSYVSVSLYEELEDLLAKIFGKKVILSTSTSMGHQAVIPIIIEDNDAVIIDQQAHFSMQETVSKLQLRGIKVQVLRHNRMDDLQQKIDSLSPFYEKIWYIMDGVYSMYGDLAPIHHLTDLLATNKQLHLYVDDAHGMSWTGPLGGGYLLNQTGLHPRIVLATSLAKGFGSAGGVSVLPDDDMYWKVKNWGGPLTFSGPQQPAVIGASIASARIHLSPEIVSLQASLMERIRAANEIARHYQLPLVSETETPIFFIGLGLTKVGYNMVKRLSDDGLYVNLGIFPAVPETCTGIRFTLTNHHSIDDIERLLQATSRHLPEALKDEQRSVKDIYRAFKSLAGRQDSDNMETKEPLRKKNEDASVKLFITTKRTINDIPEKKWNALLGANGFFNWEGLRLLEEAFAGNTRPEDNWDFYYYLIEDENGKTVLATFFTLLLCKDDMLSPAEVSKKIEKERQINPYYLVSPTFMMGTVISDGRHMYIDKENPQWKDALSLFLDKIWEDQEKVKADALYLRDFSGDDREIATLMNDHGFVKLTLPDSHIIAPEGKSATDYIAGLKHERRYRIRRDIMQYKDLFDIEIIDGRYDNQEVIDTWHSMYENVKNKNLEINIFTLPKKLFTAIARSENWDKITISLKADKHRSKTLLGIVLACRGDKNYVPLVLGINYHVTSNLNIYKQILYHTIERGIDLKSSEIFLGLTASLEKRRFGAKTQSNVAFVQIKDHLNMNIIEKIPNMASD